jgi:hypothetical protein
MGEFFILPIIVGFIILIIKILKSKVSLILKLVLSGIALFFFIIGLSMCIADGWERGSRQEAVMIPEDTPKNIYFHNKTNQSINIIVDFRYSEEELTERSKINLVFNKIDTILNLKKEDSSNLEAPIMRSDSITGFPKKFNIKITDSLGKLIKGYDKETFLKNIEESKNMSGTIKEYSLKKWTLIIK